MIGKRSLILLILVFLLAPIIGACGDENTLIKVDGRDENHNGNLSLDESSIVATRLGTELEVEIVVTENQGEEFAGMVSLGLRSLDGNLIDDVKNSFTASAGTAKLRLQLSGLPAEAETGDLADYVLHYRVETDQGDLWGRRSLYASVQKQEVLLLTPDSFFAGTRGGARLLAREPVTGQGMADTPVALYYAPQEGERELLFEGATDAFGSLALDFLTPDELSSGELQVEVQTDTGLEVITSPAQVVKDDKILLTTDKPIYQPGQTIHLRALALSRPHLHPTAAAPVLFEVRDGKGNKVFKVETMTNDFGIAATDLQLASEVNMGVFEISALIDGAAATKSVTVERYVLPKYKLSMELDQSWYQPGETLSGVLSAQYTFGKPVAGAAISLSASQFDVGFNEFAQLSGTLDEEGNFPFEIELPDYLVGGTLENGQALVQLQADVLDDAAHSQTMVRQVAVAQGGLVVNALARTQVVAGQPAALFVITTDPNGLPMVADLHLHGQGIDVSGQSSLQGIALLPFDAPNEANLSLTLDAHSADGTSSSTELSFDLGSGVDEGNIGLLTDHALYQVGDQVQLDIFTHREVMRVFVDVLQNNQTLLTQTLDVDNGFAELAFGLDATTSGAVHFEVYYPTATGKIVRSSKLVFVEAADDLEITASLDAAEYRPGEAATIDLQVTDGQGQGVQAAIGLSIVDEAVYALQEMQPGLAKIFFRIEEELLQPKVEIHGFGAADLVNDDGSEGREEAAELLMAAAGETSPYPVQINTLAAAMERSKELAGAAIEEDAERVFEKVRQLMYLGIYQENEADAIAAALNEQIADPWGQGYRILATDTYALQVVSAGPDEYFDTEDDSSISAYLWNLQSKDRGDDDFFWADGDFNAVPGEVTEDDPTVADEGGGSGESPRVRSYFPETLYFNPALITDEAGQAQLELTMADSITTWRMTSLANSAMGQLGSNTSSILVFQPFFIDIDFPVALTQNDEIAVPIALYNYLDTAQSVTLQVQDLGEDWYTLLDATEKSVQLQPNEVAVVHFRVRVDEVGWHRFQVQAIGSTMSDAIERTVEVLPDGKEFPISVSGRLESTVTETLSFPNEAIAGANALNVKIYPGLFSQVVEGLDSLFAMPSGCFEQTSSTTYPNILALRYMIETDQITPEIELQAREYVSLGYQRLLTFEVDGGGFEWFGNDPAHRILTAYGLLEFTDMAKVHPIDEALIGRTQNWLIAQQEADGRFKAAPEGIHEGATNNFQDSDLRATAYLTYALIYSEYQGAGLSQAISWLQQHASEAEDSYTLAMIANAFVLNDASAPATTAALRALADAAQQESDDQGNTLYLWSSDSQSLYYSSGNTMTMETTALALLALIEAGTYPELVEGGINYLIANKDSFGNWSSTQATILSLRAFIALLDKATADVDAQVLVSCDGVLVDTVTIDQSNADVMQQIDLKPWVGANGDHTVELEISGTGSLLYQVAGRYYLPWSDEVVDPGEILSVSVDYDRTTLEVNDTINATVTVTNNTDARLDMILVDLGVAPGFDVDRTGLDLSVSQGILSKAEISQRQIIAYLYGLDPQQTVSFSYGLVARMPLEAQTPPATAYLYYDPAVSTDAPPTDLSVQE